MIAVVGLSLLTAIGALIPTEEDGDAVGSAQHAPEVQPEQATKVKRSAEREQHRDRGRDGDQRQTRDGGQRRTRERRHPERRPGPTAVVTRVVDGDTVELGNGKTVRLIGIDTPEVYGGTECGGPQASAYMRRIASGRRVSVHTDPTQDTYDRYGRLLAYLDAGRRDLGESVIRAGWARVYVYDRPFERLAAYREGARTARSADRGITDVCSAREPKPPTAAASESAAAPAGPAPSAGPDKDCSDFTSQSAAQRYLLPGDPHGLDADGDGMACDSLG